MKRMAKFKSFTKIHKTIAIIIFVACVLTLFSPMFSINVWARSEPVFESDLSFDFSNDTDACDHHCYEENEDNTHCSDENTPCCSIPCNLSSCCIAMGMLCTAIKTDNDNLTRAALARSEQFNTEDILSSIFKPPKI